MVGPENLSIARQVSALDRVHNSRFDCIRHSYSLEHIEQNRSVWTPSDTTTSGVSLGVSPACQKLVSTISWRLLLELETLYYLEEIIH